MLKIVTIAIAINLVLLTTVASYAIEKRGEGTKNNPYQIDNCTALQAIKDDLAGYYQLTQSIDCKGKLFIPIGSKETPFTGQLSGKSKTQEVPYTINNLTIMIPKGRVVGLLAETKGAYIHDIRLDKIAVRGGVTVGSLIGIAEQTILENVIASGEVESDFIVGGLVGIAHSKSIIRESGTEVNVTSNKSQEGDGVGGLLGYVQQVTVHNSYAKGDVTGKNQPTTGGLIGIVKYSEITDSYTEGNVIGQNATGGLVGLIGESTINYSYATGNVEGANGVGGLIGTVIKPTTVNHSYAKGNVRGQEAVGGFSGFAQNVIITDCYATGDVNAKSAFVGGLLGLTKESTIQLSYATGNVKGDINIGGLGGAIISTQLSDSYAVGKRIEGKLAVGGLLGVAQNNSVIRRVFVMGDIVGAGQAAGGLIGVVLNASLHNSYMIGAISGSEAVGGVIGSAKGLSGEYIYTSSRLDGKVHVGGILGLNEGSVEIKNSYWNKETTGQLTSSHQSEAYGKTTKELQQQETYKGWDFENIWIIKEKGAFPTLRKTPSFLGDN